MAAPRIVTPNARSTGKLRHRLTIQRRRTTRGGHGGRTPTWETSATRWGSITPLTGEERIESERLGSRMTHRIRMRYLSSLTPQNRILYDSRTFEIVSVVDEEERKTMQEIRARELVT